MVIAWILCIMLPILVACTGDGNIHLMEEDVAEALRACSQMNTKGSRNPNGTRQKRFDTASNNQIPLIDANAKEDVNHSHTRRNTGGVNQLHILNDKYYNHSVVVNEGEKSINSVPRPLKRNDNSSNSSYNYAQNQRVKKNELLVNRGDNDQCLSQCVFANLHMVDSKGIPREAEVWSRVQTSVTSHQSRLLLKDQIHACFQELQLESEEDGCSYSNKLERCLTLRLSDRKIKEFQNNTTPKD